MLDALEPLTHPEVLAITAAVAQCVADLTRNFGRQAARVPPEEIVLLAAYDAATLARPRSFLRDALGLDDRGVVAFCTRLRAAAEAVAVSQGRRSVLDGFAALNAADRPDRA